MRKFLKLSVALTLFFSINACQEDQEPKISKNEIPTVAVTNKFGVSADFALNPYDNAGKVHNEILQKVVEKWDENLTTDDYINISREEFFKLYPGENPEIFLPNIKIKSILDDSDNNYATALNNPNLSPIVRNHMSSFIKLLIDFEATNNNDYAALKETIISFETSIINNSAINDKDKASILSVTSIGRHSAYFWNTIYLDALANGYSPSSIIAKKPWWKWVAVGLADVAGGISGGAAAGAVSGGVVLIGGAIAGAVGASAGASSLVDWISPPKEASRQYNMMITN
ncbi:Uncharacterised protein [Chryseobacterium nakagawai]|uniref:Glycine zipper family protein n=1 Tax=Chryseobacterium nakagawai TaxID=1241982 RepID=A0AAD0YR38_CHRNA|nr:hypothetical protein [Chryseobacterium nakagawai]AZA93597.1 hypothetical protein EG343_24825 [Chryseobacterium nakagawai]VEH20297.1 Uncharacterised protein [Chryseobacterium nakagawai]